MKRRTRLRKLGLPPDPPKTGGRCRAEEIRTRNQELEQALLKAGLHPYIARFAVDDARRYGVEQVLRCWYSTGLTPSQVLSMFSKGAK